MAKRVNESRSFWVIERGRGEIVTETLREPEEGEVLVRTLYSGISRGTEALVFKGAVPPSEFQRMRAPFQDGEFPAPVKYGYINVGRVERGPSSLEGRIVFCLYPHQTLYVVPAEAVYPLPDDVPPQRAVLAASLETAVNGLWDAAPRVGDRIVVIGAGAVGCLTTWLAARVPGCAVQLIDIDSDKARVAAALGVHFAAPARATPDADIVIHASATADGLALALQLAGFEGKIIELSWFGTFRPEVALGEAFHSRRLRLQASQVGAVAPAQRARWTVRRRMELVLRLLADPVLDAVITGESRFEELPEIMKRLATEPGGTLCHRIVY
jgi:NADPH:quinone reductase-like Zn-dependent oxidoreductase